MGEGGYVANLVDGEDSMALWVTWWRERRKSVVDLVEDGKRGIPGDLVEGGSR